ncbi:MAG: hypothetical protein V3T70_04595 [Phycisphaerae bacterium]
MTRCTIQFSIFLASKPGVLSRLCDSLAHDKINIIAMSMMDSTEHGVFRMIAEDEKQARKTLGRLNLPTAETEVIVMELPNRPGALADVCARLGTNHVGINYAYCTGSAPNGRSLAVLKVSDLKKGLKTLESRKPRRRAAATVRPRRRRV